LFVKGVVVAVAAAFVQLAPIPQGDVQKLSSSSFFTLYLAGKLDNVPHVTQMLLAAAASLVFDVFVVYYHLANPPHPKFVMAIWRKLSIYTHLISGIVEIVIGSVAFFAADQTLQQGATLVMSIASITHALTAYYQTAVVFGAKGIMTPGYLYAITLHITFAFRLVQKPTSVLYLPITFLMLHIYVWCRFFVYFFRYFSAFNGYHYTVAITLSGALLFPYAIGPIGNYAFLFIGILYCVLEAMVSDKSGKELARKLFVEHERYALLSADTISNWKEQLSSETDADDDRSTAKKVFDQYDKDKTGKLGMNELAEIVRVFDIHGHTAAKLMYGTDINHDGNLDFEEFYRLVWSIGDVRQRLIKKPHEGKPPSEKERARIVFDMLDLDGSDFIDVTELEMLLSQWGMPEGEAQSYVLKYADGTRISFETFYNQMKPIWSFAIAEVFDA